MIQDALQLGGTVAVTIGFIELIRFLVGKFVPTDGRRQADTMDLIAGNHLEHINAGITEQINAIRELTRQSHDDHTKQIEIIFEMLGIIKSQLK